jgi:hypothetical protein
MGYMKKKPPMGWNFGPICSVTGLILHAFLQTRTYLLLVVLGSSDMDSRSPTVFVWHGSIETLCS